MDPNANRSQGGRSSGANAYWQRRFFTLVAGLGVVGLLAWAVSGVASGGNSSNGTGGPSSAAYASTAAGTPSPSAPVTSAPARPSPSVPASPTATRSASATKHAAAAASRPAHPAHPARGAASPTVCPAGDVVLTVTASQPSYGPQATPAFQVDIVSTDTATCTLDTGPEGLKLVVQHGSTVAYNSASCQQGAKRHVISLRRGVPVVTSMTWDKHETVSGCSPTVMAATSRTYSAVAQDDGARSPGVSFRLTGAPAARPAQKVKPTPAGQPARARQP